MFLAAVALRAVVGVVILTWCDTQSIAGEASHQMSVQCLGVSASFGRLPGVVWRVFRKVVW